MINADLLSQSLVPTRAPSSQPPYSHPNPRVHIPYKPKLAVSHRLRPASTLARPDTKKQESEEEVSQWKAS